MQTHLRGYLTWKTHRSCVEAIDILSRRSYFYNNNPEQLYDALIQLKALNNGKPGDLSAMLLAIEERASMFKPVVASALEAVVSRS